MPHVVPPLPVATTIVSLHTFACCSQYSADKVSERLQEAWQRLCPEGSAAYLSTVGHDKDESESRQVCEPPHSSPIPGLQIH